MSYSDKTLREALVRALVVEPDRALAGAVLDRWDELTSGMPLEDLLGTVLEGSQAQVIEAYAAAIREASPALMHSPAWGRVNRAIVERWSERALSRIKREAWRLIDEE